MLQNLSDKVEDSVDKLFRETVLSKTKKLSCGRQVLIITRVNFDHGFIYFCNICGEEIGNEHDLKEHLTSEIHCELMKLKVLPYHKFMANAIVKEDDSREIDTQYDSMKRQQLMLETVCDLNIINEECYRRIERMKVEKLKESEKNIFKCEKGRSKESLKDHHKKDFMEKRPRSHDLSDSENDAKNEIRLKPYKKLKQVREKNRKQYIVPIDPDPSFMSCCRQLIALGDFIGEPLMTSIRKLFSKSIEYERQRFGGSNVMANWKTIGFLHSIKDIIAKKEIPLKFLGIVDFYNRAVDHLTIAFLQTHKIEDSDIGYDGDISDK